MTQLDPAPGAPSSQSDPAPGAPPATGPSPSDPVDISALPPNVQNLIAGLRQEAGAARTRARQSAADEARNELLGQIGQALGFEQTPDDPAVLMEQVSAHQQDAASARLELDVWRRIARHGGDPEAVLDSMRFREAIDALDADGDWDAQADEAIKKWLADNPAMRRGQVPLASGTGRPVEALHSGALPASEAQRVDMNAWMRGRR